MNYIYLTESIKQGKSVEELLQIVITTEQVYPIYENGISMILEIIKTNIQEDIKELYNE